MTRKVNTNKVARSSKKLAEASQPTNKLMGAQALMIDATNEYREAISNLEAAQIRFNTAKMAYGVSGNLLNKAIAEFMDETHVVVPTV